MKAKMFALLLAMSMLAGCGQAQTVSAPMAESVPAQEVQEQEETKELVEVVPVQTPDPESEPEQSKSEEIPEKAVEAEPEKQKEQPTSEPVQGAKQGTSPAQPAAPAPVSMAYGEIPFSLSAGTETWWQIDSSDSAYWAVRDNINAIRAAGGLGALSMSDGLSAAASSRCESFVAGGPFDHSGMTTASEICACGPIGSASSVCSMWQNSPDHYANIMRSDFTSMGVGCWFCSIGGNNYTYWVVTFG